MKSGINYPNFNYSQNFGFCKVFCAMTEYEIVEIARGGAMTGGIPCPFAKLSVHPLLHTGRIKKIKEKYRNQIECYVLWCQINKMLVPCILYSEEIGKKRLQILLTGWKNLRIINMGNWKLATGKKRMKGITHETLESHIRAVLASVCAGNDDCLRRDTRRESGF